MWPPEYAKALKDFNHAIKLDDKDAMAYNNRGILYTKVQPPDYKNALEDYNRAIELNPEFAGAYSNRGLVYMSEASPDYNKALNEFTRAIELNPNLAMAYLMRGSTYAMLNDGPKARKDYNVAIKIDPRLVDYPLHPAFVEILGAGRKEADRPNSRKVA